MGLVYGAFRFGQFDETQRSRRQLWEQRLQTASYLAPQERVNLLIKWGARSVSPNRCLVEAAFGDVWTVEFVDRPNIPAKVLVDGHVLTENGVDLLSAIPEASSQSVSPIFAFDFVGNHPMRKDGAETRGLGTGVSWAERANSLKLKR